MRMCAFVCIHYVSVLPYEYVYVFLEAYVCVPREVSVCVCRLVCANVCSLFLVCVLCVTDIIWCRLVSVLRLQAVSQRLIDKWIWFANVIKLIRKKNSNGPLSFYLNWNPSIHWRNVWLFFLLEIRITIIKITCNERPFQKHIFIRHQF